MKKYKKTIIWALIIISAIALGLLLKSSNGHIKASLVIPEITEVRKTVSASGNVISKKEINLSLPALGILESLSVEAGQRVYAGNIIASLYNYDSSQTAQANKKGLDVTKRDLQIYIENYSTQTGAVGGEDEYKLGVKRLKELVERAEAVYQASLGSLSKTILNTPTNGTVIDTYYEVGEVVGAGSTVAKIADLDNLIFEGSVDQEDFGLLSIGQGVEVTLDAYEDITFEGTLVELPNHVDESTDEFIIKVTVVGKEGFPILLGMDGDLDIIVEKTSGEVTALTFDKIYLDDDATYVWINEDGILKKMILDVGLEGDIYTEVRDDLDNIEIVLPEKPGEAIEGVKVKVNNEK